jgi:CRISPR-associated endonuclease/helicase Cas3
MNSFSYHLESHRGKYLVEHLKQVSDIAVLIIKNLQKYYPCIADHKLIEAIKIIAFSHDTGKSTSFFQDYLHGIKQDPFLKSHSTLSSLYAYFTCQVITGDDFISFIALMLVQGHHGIIPSPSSIVKRIHTRRTELMQQFSNILHRSELDMTLTAEGFPRLLDCSQMLEYTAADLHRIKSSFCSSLKSQNRLKTYFITNILFSALIDADRMNAAGIEPPGSVPIDYQTIIAHVEEIERNGIKKFGHNSEILNMRKLVRLTVLNNVNLDQKIFSLTAPTGSGKTLTAFSFANIIRHKIFEKTERQPRIIYVLPFLSIIDQNEKVIETALGLSSSSQSALMITHHHLSKLVYEDIGKESFSTAASQLIIEGWNAEVIVTTFVQFLETVIGTSASSLRKLHNLAGSIVILDEVQSIDYKHWKLIHDCLNFLANELDVRIILMTATQPLIFKENEVLELFDIKHNFPERVHFNIDLDGILIDKFCIKLNKIIAENQNKSILVIMNTIASSIHVFKSINVPEGIKFYLSSEVVPVERRQRIQIISERLEVRKKTVLISTQVVEAGVDFDFDIVIRDLAPVDSIVQAAGRCNRNGERPSSESPVYIFAVHDKYENYFANRIYGNTLIEKTRDTLIEPDLNVEKLADIYFQKVKKAGSNQKSLEILAAIKELDYEEIKRKFKVIEDEATVSIFVEIDEIAETIWTEYKNISLIALPEVRRRTLRDFFRAKRATFYSYVINSRPSVIEQYDIRFEEPFYRIERDLISKVYDYTGLKRK